ncbi:hypothetical protein [Streptomyces sp. R41]|uniref:Hydrolase n=1 Tax=Streptomyces sp. R41 TaxID=3238632 RepID=A0AB39RJX4_9ACTN
MPRVEHQDSTVLTDEELRTLYAHWRAANYLAAGQILLANPLPTEPASAAHICAPHSTGRRRALRTSRWCRQRHRPAGDPGPPTGVRLDVRAHRRRGHPRRPGRFRDRDAAALHLKGGARTVLLSAPGKNADAFLEATRRLGVPADRAAVVEDALVGVEAGRRGGFRLVVGVDRACTPATRAALLEHGAGLVVDDLAELLAQKE